MFEHKCRDVVTFHANPDACAKNGGDWCSCMQEVPGGFVLLTPTVLLEHTRVGCFQCDRGRS